MKQLLLGLGLVACVTTVQAQSGRIVKIKGTRAIVEFEQGTEAYPGDKIFLKETSRQDSASTRGGPFQNRNYALTYSWVSSVGSSASTSTGHQGEIYFGWNFKQFEVGPTFGLSIAEQSTIKVQATAFGAKGKYNFIENKKNTEWVPGLYAEFSTASTTTTTSASSSSSSYTTTGAGLLVDWFPLGNNVALGGFLGLKQVKTSSATTNLTSLGTSITLYF